MRLGLEHAGHLVDPPGDDLGDLVELADPHDRDEVDVAGLTMEVLHTPGHTPGSVCFYVKDLATVFTGDTLFKGGPGATGRNFSDRGVLLMSITDRLMPLPRQTIVKTGHGDDTTIADERAGILDASAG